MAAAAGNFPRMHFAKLISRAGRTRHAVGRPPHRNHLISSFLPAFGLIVFKSLFSLARSVWNGSSGTLPPLISGVDRGIAFSIAHCAVYLGRLSTTLVGRFWKVGNHTSYRWQSAMWPLQELVHQCPCTNTFISSHFIWFMFHSVVLYLIQMQPCRSVIHFKDGRGWITSRGEGNIVSIPLI